MDNQLAKKFKDIIDEIKLDLKQKKLEKYDIKEWLDFYYNQNTRDLSTLSPELQKFLQVIGMLVVSVFILYIFMFIPVYLMLFFS